MIDQEKSEKIDKYLLDELEGKELAGFNDFCHTDQHKSLFLDNFGKSFLCRNNNC